MASTLYIDTLDATQIATLEARLRPGNSSVQGFLGRDESLKAIIYEDAETLRQLGITHEQLADRLEYVMTHPDEDTRFRVRVQTWRASDREQGHDPFLVRPEQKPAVMRGMQEDPFQGEWSCPPYSNADYTVTNTGTGESIGFPGLILTLIRQYQFFEGRGTQYRLDPGNAVRVLELKPGEDYSAQLAKPQAPTGKPQRPETVWR